MDGTLECVRYRQFMRVKPVCYSELSQVGQMPQFYSKYNVFTGSPGKDVVKHSRLSAGAQYHSKAN